MESIKIKNDVLIPLDEDNRREGELFPHPAIPQQGARQLITA